MSPQLLCSQDFFKQLLQLRGSARKGLVTFSLLAQLCCDQNDMFEYRSNTVL